MTRPPSVLGPLFWQERDRIGRRPSFYLLRVAVPLLLLGLLYQMHPAGERLTPRDQARFAEGVFWAVMAVQYFLVWLFTPSFAAAVLTEEREKQTLDLLLTTTLTNRELVVGKLFARLAVVGVTILAGLPVVALLQCYGGFQTEQLVVAYLGLFVNLFGVGGAAAGIAARCQSYRVAFYVSVPLLLVVSFIPVFGPWQLLIAASDGVPVSLARIVAFVAGNVAVGTAGITMALAAVSPMRTATTAPPPRRARVVGRVVDRPRYVRLAEPVSVPAATKRAGVRSTIDWQFPAGDCPGPSPRQTAVGLFLAAAAVGLTVGLAAFDGNRHAPAYQNNRAAQSGYSPALTLWLIPTAVVAAVSTAGLVTREREADTLVMLLTVPTDRAELLWRKLLRSLLPAGLLGGLTAAVVCLYLLTRDDRAWLLVYAAQAALVVTAAATVGLFVSLTTRTTVMAQLTAVLVGLMIPAVAPFLAFAYEESERFVIAGYLAGLAGVTAASWRFAVRVFERM